MKDFEDSVYLNNFGITLKKLRHSKGLTQEQLAHTLQITPSAITMYESGTRNPSIKVLLKLSNIFNISIDELINVSYTKNNAMIEALLGISVDEFNSLTPAQRQSIRYFIDYVKNKEKHLP